MPARTRKPAATPRRPNLRDSGVYAQVGASGHPVVNIAGVDVEISHTMTHPHTGETVVGSVWFPVPGTNADGIWAGVQVGCFDPLSYMIGWGGWQHDEYPTLESAVAAMLDPKVRARIEARTAHARRIADLEQRVRELRAAWPDAPAGAIVRDVTR